MIEVQRFEGPGGQCRSWNIVESSSGWSVTQPDAPVARYTTLIAALRESGACTFSPNTALQIRTDGSITNFDLLPALGDWLDGPLPEENDPYDWSDHPELGWVQEHIWTAFEGLGFNSARVIVIDDDVCGVCDAPLASEPSSTPLIIPCDGTASRLVPKFMDLWATLVTDNGYGSCWYGTGEVVPGVRGNVMDGDGIGPFLSLDRLPTDHPEGLYDRVLDWMANRTAMTPGMERFELEVARSRVSASFPENNVYAEVDGWLGRTVLRSRPKG